MEEELLQTKKKQSHLTSTISNIDYLPNSNISKFSKMMIEHKEVNNLIHIYSHKVNYNIKPNPKNRLNFTQNIAQVQIISPLQNLILLFLLSDQKQKEKIISI